MIDQVRQVESDGERREVFLYHGTNCFRRWEINREGKLQPGRSGYSFFCSNAEDAFNYARNACLRDIRAGASNSLTCEPVVLKVSFNERTWIQVDFIQEIANHNASRQAGFSVAVLGPVSSANITQVKHCSHGRRREAEAESVRTFADGKLLAGIKNLKRKTSSWRLDAWLLKTCQQAAGKVSTFLTGKQMPELSLLDELTRLSQLEYRLHLKGSGSSL